MTEALVVSLTLSAAALASLPMSPTMVTDAVDRVARSPLPSAGRRALAVAAGVMATGLLLGFWPWWLWVAAAGASGAVTVAVPARTTQAQRADERRRLAVHDDLLAACLDAGMSVGAGLLAIRSETTATSGPPLPGPRSVNRRPTRDDPMQMLEGVAALLTLGADTESAWRSAAGHPDLASLAAAAKRSAAGGTGFADAVREHASTLRTASADAAERSAGRAAVAVTAPLGLCFLPAFLCLGLAPVVVGLLSGLDLF